MWALRTLVGLVLVGALLGMASVMSTEPAAGTSTGPAAAGSTGLTGARAGAWVEVAPSTVSSGSQVTIRATCVDNSADAKVRSTAFGTVVVKPVGAVLTAQVRVPSGATEGSQQVTLTCKNGSTATTTLLVLSSSSTNMTSGPHTGGGFLASNAASSDDAASSSDDSAASGDRVPGQGLGPAPIWLLAVGILALTAAAALVTTRRLRRR